MNTSNKSKNRQTEDKKMTHTQLLQKIESLGYKGFKESYERQCEDINYAKMSFEERLYQLLDAQELFLKNIFCKINGSFKSNHSFRTNGSGGTCQKWAFRRTKPAIPPNAG